MLAYLVEAVLFIELSSHVVVLKHIKLEVISNTPCMVHQCTPDSLAMVIRVNEEPPDFVPDQRNKTDHSSILLDDPRLGVWQIDLSDPIPFLTEKRFVEEWMANQRRRVPGPKQFTQVCLLIRSDHSFPDVSGEHF